MLRANFLLLRCVICLIIVLFMFNFCVPVVHFCVHGCHSFVYSMKFTYKKKCSASLLFDLEIVATL